jgi:hypothetical protein
MTNTYLSRPLVTSVVTSAYSMQRWDDLPSAVASAQSWSRRPMKSSS